MFFSSTPLKTWKTLPILKFLGVRDKSIDSKRTIHRHAVIQMFSLYFNDSAWAYNPDFMYHLSLSDGRLLTFSSNIAVTFFKR